MSLAGGATISAGANDPGTLTLSGTEAQINAALATLTYQGALNYTGSDTLTITSTDTNGGTDVDTVAITVTAVNDPTVVTGGTSGTGTEDTIISGTLTATDVDGLSDGTVFTVTGAATNGTASIDPATGLWSYTPNADFNGSDSFTVTITDDVANTATQVISVTVSPVVATTDDRLVVTQPSGNVGAIPGAVLINPETKGNAGRQQQSGLALSAQWRFRLGGDWTGDLWGSASWVHGLIDEGNGVDWAIPYVASHKLKLGTTLRWRNQVSITPQLYWSGNVTNGRKQGPTDPLLPQGACQGAMTAPSRCSTPGYALVDLHLGWHKLLDGHATLWLDVYNLLDRRYYAAGGAGLLTFLDMPQQPRTWVVTLDYRF